MKNYKAYVIIGVSCLLIGRYILQPKQEVKEVIKVVEVEKKIKEEKKKVRTETRETIKPDGSKETTVVVTEDSSSRESEARESKSETTLVAKSGAGITLGLLALKDLNKFSDKTEFGILTSVPLIGNISVVGTADTAKRIGLGLSLEF